MPKKQSTAAQNARKRQAETSEKYTRALRAETPPAIRHYPFSARGAGWAPILERAEAELSRVWPGHPQPHWEEKFGRLEWKSFAWQASLISSYPGMVKSPWEPPRDPEGARRIIRDAAREAARTCQSCPSPGRRRVIWLWDDYYGGWTGPWVKTCCDVCGFVPEHLKKDDAYLCFVEDYEDPS